MKSVKCLGIAAILIVLMLGATDTVAAQENGSMYNPEFVERRVDPILSSVRPLRVEEEVIGDERQEELVPGQVPLYSQLDNLGTEWTSCGPTTLAMALNYSSSGPTPQEIIKYAISQRGRDGTPLYKPQDPEQVYTSPQHLYEMAEQYGRPQAGWITDEKEAVEKLRALLNQDLPVIVDVTVSLTRNGSTAAHFVLVTGIGMDNTVTVHDPYGRGQGAKVRAVSWEDFYWAWQNNSDGAVGGHGWWMVVRSDWSPVAGSV
jgi:uncharacterized protein YvpB